MIKELIKMASTLDSMGLKMEADSIDRLIRKLAEDDSDSFEFKPDGNLDPNNQSKKISGLLKEIGEAREAAAIFMGNNQNTFNTEDMIGLYGALHCESIISFLSDTYSKMRRTLSKDDKDKFRELDKTLSDVVSGIRSIVRLGESLNQRGDSSISKDTLESHATGFGSLIPRKVEEYINFLVNDFIPFAMDVDKKIVLD